MIEMLGSPHPNPLPRGLLGESAGELLGASRAGLPVGYSGTRLRKA